MCGRPQPVGPAQWSALGIEQGECQTSGKCLPVSVRVLRMFAGVGRVSGEGCRQRRASLWGFMGNLKGYLVKV